MPTTVVRATKNAKVMNTAMTVAASFSLVEPPKSFVQQVKSAQMEIAVKWGSHIAVGSARISRKTSSIVEPVERLVLLGKFVFLAAAVRLALSFAEVSASISRPIETIVDAVAINVPHLTEQLSKTALWVNV